MPTNTVQWLVCVGRSDVLVCVVCARRASMCVVRTSCLVCSLSHAVTLTHSAQVCDRRELGVTEHFASPAQASCI